jgi:chromosome segregation ATPase
MSALRQRLAQTEDEIADLEKIRPDYLKAQEEIMELRGVRAELEATLDDLRQTISQHADEMAKAKQAQDELEESVGRQASEIGRLDRTIAGLRASRERAEEEKKALYAELQGTRASLDQQRSITESMANDIAAERANLQAQIHNLGRTVNDIQLSPFWRLRNRIDSALRSRGWRRRPKAHWESP